MNKIYKIIATFFYAGLIPWAPGTMGTLGAAILYTFLWKVNFASFPILLTVLILASAGNLWVGNWAEEYFGKKDPSCVVIDEVAGYFLTVLLFKPSWEVVVSGFLLFRLFDISKPYPIRLCEKLPGGLGILLDDLAAAVYAAFILSGFSFASRFYNWNFVIIPTFWQW